MLSDEEKEDIRKFHKRSLYQSIAEACSSLQELNTRISSASDEDNLLEIEQKARNLMEKLIFQSYELCEMGVELPPIFSVYFARQFKLYMDRIAEEGKASDPAILAKTLNLQGTKKNPNSFLDYSFLAQYFSDGYRTYFILQLTHRCREPSKSLEERGLIYRQNNRVTVHNKGDVHDKMQLFFIEGFLAAQKRKKWPIKVVDFQKTIESYFLTGPSNARKIIKTYRLKELLTEENAFSKVNCIEPDYIDPLQLRLLLYYGIIKEKE